MSETSAALIWGVKRSLVRYVSDMHDGDIALSDGASELEGRVFRFEADPDGAADGIRRFRGHIVLTAHEGLLEIGFADPWLEPREKGVTLTVFSDIDERRVDMARLEVEGDGYSARLTDDGADVLGPQYMPATEVDPVAVR